VLLFQNQPSALRWSSIYNKSISEARYSYPRYQKEKRMIRREYIILIIGGALFVAGIIVANIWAIPFPSTLLQENILINQVSIEPGRSVEETTQVTDVSRPITVAIPVERPEEGGTAEEEEDGRQEQVSQREQPVLTLIETVKDPSGVVVSNKEFSTDLFTTFQPQNTGNYTLNISNAGARGVTIDATFGYMPFMTSTAPHSSEDDGVDQPQPGVDISSLSVVIVAGTLTAIGFFTIVAGIVKVIIDSPRVPIFLEALKQKFQHRAPHR